MNPRHPRQENDTPPIGKTPDKARSSAQVRGRLPQDRPVPTKSPADRQASPDAAPEYKLK